MLQTILLALHILVAIGLIGLILLQQGQGATTGAAFGSGASTTVFGARGSASFLTRATAILAIVFFANSFLLSYRSGEVLQQQGLMERVGVSGQTDLPAVPGSEDAVSVLPAAPVPEVATEAATVPATATEVTVAGAPDPVAADPGPQSSTADPGTGNPASPSPPAPTEP